MAAGLEPVVVLWNGWGIHFMVVVSFAVQVALLLLADTRRRKDWAVLKVIIWSAYLLADTTAIYALGHMSVVCRSPEHHLVALWAPLLLVHLGGQDSITAYAVEDNRLWLRHLQSFVLQVASAAYVLYASSILFHPSGVRSAAVLMFVVGVVMRADSSPSSSLSATTYSSSSTTGAAAADSGSSWSEALVLNTSEVVDEEDKVLAIAYALLDVPKKMFEGPTRYVRITKDRTYDREKMVGVVKMQLSMMYDLLYTKAAVLHTWYGLCSRVLVSLPFTVAAALLVRRSMTKSGGGNDDDDAAARYRSADVAVTNVLLTGAVVLETMSVLRAIFSKWTAALLFQKKRYRVGQQVLFVESVVTWTTAILVQSEPCWSGSMPQHNFFRLKHHSGRSRGSKIAKLMGREDWWDSMFYSWTSRVPEDTITQKVVERGRLAVSSYSPGHTDNIINSWCRNALSTITCGDLARWMEMERWDLDESILAWHIATDVYIQWFRRRWSEAKEEIKPKSQRTKTTTKYEPWYDSDYEPVITATKCLSNYMFFLLAARPYMLPYPVSRHKYVQLCHFAVTRLTHLTAMNLLKYIEDQQSLVAGINLTFDRGCQLAEKLINKAKNEPAIGAHGILNMIFDGGHTMLHGLLVQREFSCKEPGQRW